jgi:glycosyltransferase involved in cell wall biosynthesis
VLKGFLPALKELGEVLAVKDPETEVDRLYEECQRRGESCIYLSFSPPNKSAVGLRCPTVCIFAWEFDRIPDEGWDDDQRNDWRYVLSNHGRAITLSQFAAEAVKKRMGNQFAVTAIPVPVWDHFADFRQRCGRNTKKKPLVVFEGNVIDSQNYQITPESITLLNPLKCIQIKTWRGETIHSGCSDNDEFSAHLGGFYKPENWGVWSRNANPWILLPYQLCGTIDLTFVARGYGHNCGRNIDVSIGAQTQSILLKEEFSEFRLRFRLRTKENMIHFSNLNLTPIPGSKDPRSLGIALRQIGISGTPQRSFHWKNIFAPKKVRKVKLDGVVYTSMFSPRDGRKNWEDLVTAFCFAFRDVQDATLVLKMAHHSMSTFSGKLHFLLQQMWPFKCRIVALHGYLHATEYEALISATTYYVNASRCEGLCLPVMEFMACGKPAIAPCHTAMADYIDRSSSFIVDSSLEPCMWPHDPRNLFSTMRYRIDWNSMVNAYHQSYEIAKTHAQVYHTMAESASLAMKRFASIEAVKSKLAQFFNLNSCG